MNARSPAAPPEHLGHLDRAQVGRLVRAEMKIGLGTRFRLTLVELDL
jgi:hypothetical protein